MQKKTVINDAFLNEIISIESYSMTGKAECSDRIARELSGMGFQVRMVTDYGAPIILATYNAKADKNILFYMHYDVKPAGDISAWNTSPFQLHYDIQKDKFYGRGTGDDKGQIYAVITGIREVIHSHMSLNYNISIVIEGDEENGSPGLRAFAEKELGENIYNKVIVFDSHWLMNHPVIFLGCRGQLDIAIKYTDEKMENDYHAGNFGGLYEGACSYLLKVMGKLLTDITNIVNIANETIRTERNKATRASQTSDIMNAVSMTYFSSGNASRSLIPKEAIARIDVRYLEDETADEVLELLDYYSKTCGVTYEIKQREDGMHNSADAQEIAFLKDIIEQVTSLDVKVMDYCGAYLPLRKIQSVHGVKYVIPIAQTDENNHAPNENISVGNILYGIEITKRILTFKSKRMES